MDKISCNVINDILPLYADDVVSEDTRKLVNEHLSGCRECSQRLSDIRSDIRTDIETQAAEAEKHAVVAAKKKLRTKRIITIILSVVVGAVIISMIIAGMRLVKIPVEYDESRFRAVVREEGGEDCLFLRYKGRYDGHELVATRDANTGEEEMYIELYTTAWGNLFGNENDDSWHELSIWTLNDRDGGYINELRLISGDIRQFYEPTRDYEKLIENSTLLWERKDGITHSAEPEHGLFKAQQ